jgi:twitching motility protein PilT
VEKSGFQGQPGEFVPVPVPGFADEEAPAAAGWQYSYVAEPGLPTEPVVATPVDDAVGSPVTYVAEPPAPYPTQPPATYAAEAGAVAPPQPSVPLYDAQPAAAFAVPPAAAAELSALAAEPVAETATARLATPALAPAPVHQAALPPASASWHADVVSLDEPSAPETAVLVQESEAPQGAYQRGNTETSSDGDDIVLNDLLMLVLDRGASDLHLTSGARPAIRQNGALVQLDDQPILTPPVIQRVLYAALTQKQREKFEENLELDFAYSVPGRARFRVNVYRQRDALGAAFRIIPFEIRKLEDLGVPPSVANFAQLPRGFVLVTGPTGSGKSTTLASLVDLANRTRREHIMTVEDPIEFLHRHQQCIVNQREVGEDTWSFSNALKHVLRQDPDIILVGEMRDLETISVALTAAETGHLVFATLHTQDAAQTIDRIIDVFPPHQQQQVRVQLAGSLQGVVCQTLAKTADGRGRAVATEVLVATAAVRNLIREGKTHQIYSAMQAGAKHGMHTMDQHLADLVKKGRITYETGLEKCHHAEDFNKLTGRG